MLNIKLELNLISDFINSKDINFTHRINYIYFLIIEKK